MLIGISGKIGSGKDTLGHMLTKLNVGFNTRKFATKLKQTAALLTGVEDQYSQEGKNIFVPHLNMTVGEFQQQLGTKMREIDPNIWINGLFVDVQPKEKTLITDVRFPNEAQAVLDRNGILVRLNGTRITDSKRDLNHISETALDDWQQWHFVFDNTDATIEQLQIFASLVYASAKLKIQPDFVSEARTKLYLQKARPKC